jgi:hypothetical protein
MNCTELLLGPSKAICRIWEQSPQIFKCCISFQCNLKIISWIIIKEYYHRILINIMASHGAQTMSTPSLQRKMLNSEKQLV